MPGGTGELDVARGWLCCEAGGAGVRGQVEGWSAQARRRGARRDELEDKENYNEGCTRKSLSRRASLNS
eukprot:287863-Rhodomonas_salina.3